jgi:dTDP-glucose pyrophosphorylase
MLNIVIPMSAPNLLDPEHFFYPKQLIEVQGKPLIEHTMEPFLELSGEVNFYPIVSASDVSEFNIDAVLKLLLGDSLQLIELSKATKGAACSALMAIDYINNDHPLIITSSDHVISTDLQKAISYFEENDFDAGTICFNSIHPKWSFVKLDEKGLVVETAEKRPLSRNAIAGFYYFKRGRDFVQAAMAMIKKGAEINNSFYISPTLNELILENKRIGIYTIEHADYHNIYDTSALTSFENYLRGEK